MRQAGHARGSPFRFDVCFKALKSSASSPIRLIGVDEAGRGPLAGPVVASAVCLPPDFFDSELTDSKLLSPQIRERLFGKITACAAFGIGIMEVESIDTINILQATYRAMKIAVDDLVKKNPGLIPDWLIIDGLPVPDLGYPQESIIEGDLKSASIAAAGVVAKVTRDRIMIELHRQYPEYGFARHKGYGTRGHVEKLLAHGPCPIHRKSFAPVKDCLEKQAS